MFNFRRLCAKTKSKISTTYSVQPPICRRYHSFFCKANILALRSFQQPHNCRTQKYDFSAKQTATHTCTTKRFRRRGVPKPISLGIGVSLGLERLRNAVLDSVREENVNFVPGWRKCKSFLIKYYNCVIVLRDGQDRLECLWDHFTVQKIEILCVMKYWAKSLLKLKINIAVCSVFRSQRH